MSDTAITPDVQGGIKGLPDGAVVRPIKADNDKDKDGVPKIKGLPEGAVVKPIKSTAPDTPGNGRKRDRKPTTDQSIQKFFENHPIVREIALGSASGVGIPETSKENPAWAMVKGFSHTIADPPKTKDEHVFAATLPAYRIAKGLVQQAYGYPQEAFDAVDWSTTLQNYQKSRTAPFAHVPTDLSFITLKEGSGGGPQMAHAVSGMATMIVAALVGGKKAPEAMDAATRAAETTSRVVKEGPTVMAQRMAGTGPMLAKEVATESVETAGKNTAEIAKAKGEYIQKAGEHRAGTVEASRVETQHSGLKQMQESYADKALENVKSAHKSVRSSLDKRWNGLREAVGTDHPVKAPEIYNAIEKSRAMLSGVPADLKIFNDLVKEITEKGEKVETESGDLQSVPKESIPFDDARTQFSAVGEKAYAAEGNLRRAMFNVYEAYDKALSAAADEAGQGKAYTALKGDWKQYMKDWHDMSGQATGGSSLARLYRALDKSVALRQILGLYGNDLRARLGRYREYGADPELASSARKYNAVEKTLPKKVKVPAKPVYSPPEKLPEPTLEEIIKKTQEAKLEQAGIAKEKALTPTGHDAVLGLISGIGVVGLHSIAYAIPYTVARLGEMALVSSELGQRWLSKITPADIRAINEVLNKVPDKRSSVGKAITNGLVEKAKNGQPMPPLNTFAPVLNNEEMQQVMQAAMKAKTNPVATPAGGGGHAGNVAMSAEELSRPGQNYAVPRSGYPTYHGKEFDPGSVSAGSAHVTVRPDGTVLVNSGELTPQMLQKLEEAVGKKLTISR
jgi:hypothetical protein